MNKAASRNNAAKSAIESAALDAVGKTLGVPAATFLDNLGRLDLIFRGLALVALPRWRVAPLAATSRFPSVLVFEVTRLSPVIFPKLPRRQWN
jgi:hypothetical protein